MNRVRPGPPDFIQWKLCAAALLALLGWVLCARLSHPWTDNDDYNGAFWSQAARNLSVNGFLATAGVPAPLYFGPPPVPAEALYVHHPTLLAAMMVLDRALLGESEAAARCLPVFFSLLAAALLCHFASLCFGWRGAVFVLAFFIAAPMELHYGQMVNFEAPELFFLLAALYFFHLWRWRRMVGMGAGLLLCCCLAMGTDWQGYLVVIALSGRLLLAGRERSARMAVALLLAALVCGIGFLLQIHAALPGAWGELFHALRERTGRGDASGGAFTGGQWLRTEATYLTTLFHPAALVLAGLGAMAALRERARLSAREGALLETGALFFAVDLFYVCALRNQSYIHDFAGFYFLVPVAIFPGFLIEWGIRKIEARWPGWAGIGATFAGGVIAAMLIWSGIGRLDGIDTQFCILDDDDREPATLMPDVGRLIDRTFPREAVVICNFDRYYSPLAYYARRVMVNGAGSYAEWRGAIADARPEPVGGIVWRDAPGAAELLSSLRAGEKHAVTVDGVEFVLWAPTGKN